MPSVCFYFEVHQPHRVKPHDAFRMGEPYDLFDEKLNREIMQKVAAKSYLPANEAMLRLIDQHDGKFRVAYSVTGVVIEQMRRWAPEVLASFKRLAATGAVEFIAETYYHSLAALYERDEFAAQVKDHVALVQDVFGQTPRIFRNTELIYDDAIGELAADLGYDAVLAEGVDDILDWRSPNFVYGTSSGRAKLLLKNYRLSDDIAYRFSNREWENFPLTAQKFAEWVHQISGGDTLNLFMDYETFGEHQWADTGIFDFLHHLPDEILEHDDWDFATPSELIARYPVRENLSVGRTTSWADVERDTSAWRGNSMQDRAIAEIYELGQEIKRRNNPALLSLWRRLQTSDHFYYMCTKWFADGDVHAYFSPFESPYEAFISYMRVLEGMRGSILGEAGPTVRS